MSMRKIYREIAKKHGVSVAEVKRDMQAAIDAAYAKPNSLALEVNRKGNKPTTEEFIAHVARMASDGEKSFSDNDTENIVMQEHRGKNT